MALSRRWRGRPLALAETVTNRESRHVFAALNYGPYVGGTETALRRAEELDEPDAELRLLQVPALYLVALWLHRPAESTLIPVAPAPRGIEPNAAYPANRLVELLSERARQAPDYSGGRGD